MNQKDDTIDLLMEIITYGIMFSYLIVVIRLLFYTATGT